MVLARSRWLRLDNWHTSSARWEQGVDPHPDVPEDLEPEQIHPFVVFHGIVCNLSDKGY